MKTKKFVTEAEKKALSLEKEQSIIESFVKTYNKIKRIDEAFASVGPRLKGKEYEIYHKTLNSALEEVKKYVEEKSAEIPENGFDKFTFGGVKYGETKRDNIQLNYHGTPIKNSYIAIQIYRMDSGTYELNMYLTKSLPKN